MGIRAIIRSKKGLSPLIATILLIAFAVALGAVVMNLGRMGGTDADPVESGCGMRGNLEIPKIGGEYKICLMEIGKDSYVDFTIHNVHLLTLMISKLQFMVLMMFSTRILF